MSFARIREFLITILIAFLPFHALLVTVGTKLIFGPGHAPMPVLAIWKEGLLAVILGVAIIEILRSGQWKFESGKWWMDIDVIDLLILLLLVIALFTTSFFSSSTAGAVLGFKYDFIPLIAFMILRRVSWSDAFRSHAENVLLAVGGIVALYGIITLLLPGGFFSALGYSDAHSLYLPDGPLAAFQQIGGTGIRRVQSTFSGPNQFGIWLLIPLSIVIARAVAGCGLRVAGKISKPETRNPKLFVIAELLLIALILTFSRSAWIAAALIFVVMLWQVLPRKIFIKVIPALTAMVILMMVIGVVYFWHIIGRSISLRDHIGRPIQAIQMIVSYPLGTGLGAAGPASNRTHEPCVFLEEGSDPTWAQKSPELCVFVGKIQVQPSGHPCDCPFLSENWYLQIGVELGLMGFLIYCALILLILLRLAVKSEKLKVKNDARETFHFSLFSFLFFFGISIAAFFLHAWEDAAVAYTAWILITGIIHPWSIPAPPVLSER